MLFVQYEMTISETECTQGDKRGSYEGMRESLSRILYFANYPIFLFLWPGESFNGEILLVSKTTIKFAHAFQISDDGDYTPKQVVLF